MTGVQTCALPIYALRQMGLGSLRVEQQLPVNGAAYGTVIAPLLRQKGAGLPEGVESSHAAPVIAIIPVDLIVRKAGTGLRRSGAGQRHKV